MEASTLDTWTGVVVAAANGVRRLPMKFAHVATSYREHECVDFYVEKTDAETIKLVKQAFEQKRTVMAVFNGRLLVGPIVDYQDNGSRLQFLVQGSL